MPGKIGGKNWLFRRKKTEQTVELIGGAECAMKENGRCFHSAKVRLPAGWKMASPEKIAALIVSVYF